MPSRQRRLSAAQISLFGMLAIAMLCSQTGCIAQFAANMLHAINGDAIAAEYDGLEGQRVAIYAVTDTSQYTDDMAARELTRNVGGLLLSEVDDLKLVRELEVSDWRDTRGFNNVDAVALGRGVKADKVISIEMYDLRLRDGQTMYKGTADVTITVHDVETGSIEFRRSLQDYTYPVMAGLPITESTDERFQRLYLRMLAKRIAQHFHPYDFRDSVANDATIASFNSFEDR